MTSIIFVQEQWKNCKMTIKIGNQPTVTYNNIKIDEVVRFVTSHQELLLVSTDSNKLYKILEEKINCYNVELQFRVS
jgi:hypothetical protein